MHFNAIVVETDINEYTANVFFADPETNPDEPSVLMFSLPIDFEGGNYYFEINDQSQGTYGNLEAVNLTRNSIAIRLSDEAVAEFGNEDLREVQVAFEIDDALYQSVLETMKRIFDGFGVLKVS